MSQQCTQGGTGCQVVADHVRSCQIVSDRVRSWQSMSDCGRACVRSWQFVVTTAHRHPRLNDIACLNARHHIIIIPCIRECTTPHRHVYDTTIVPYRMYDTTSSECTTSQCHRHLYYTMTLPMYDAASSSSSPTQCTMPYHIIVEMMTMTWHRTLSRG